jgi:hypothetical protein
MVSPSTKPDTVAYEGTNMSAIFPYIIYSKYNVIATTTEMQYINYLVAIVQVRAETGLGVLLEANAQQ